MPSPMQDNQESGDGNKTQEKHSDSEFWLSLNDQIKYQIKSQINLTVDLVPVCPRTELHGDDDPIILFSQDLMR